MRKQSLFVVALIVLITAAACDSQIQPTAPPPSPTEEVTPAPSATPLELRRPTLPPTWTPSPDPNGAQVQATTDTQSANVQTTAVQQVTQVPAFIPATPLEVCATLGEDRERNKRTFVIGESPQVFWIPVQGAASYSISLIDETGTVIHTDYTTEPTFTFDSTLFQQGKLYGWEVYPIDAIGQQMCLGRGAELFPEGLVAITPVS
jgi:hypothetical protein